MSDAQQRTPQYRACQARRTGQLTHDQAVIAGEHAAAGAGQLDSTAAAAAAGDGVPEQEHAAPPAAGAHHADSEVEGSAADRGSSKASLQRYRKVRAATACSRRGPAVAGHQTHAVSPAAGCRCSHASAVFLLACAVQASAEIMRLLAQSAPGCPFEKASIDEAYLDITGLAVSGTSVPTPGRA